MWRRPARWCQLNDPGSPNKQSIVTAIIHGIAYTLADVLANEKININKSSYTSAENIVERFFHELEHADRKNRSVGEYAELLNITPKYFSSICKRVTGRTAGDIIDEAVVNEATLLLRDNSLSVKQIADRLGFSNQSHFGTFFRRKTGCSPQHFRRSQ